MMRILKGIILSLLVVLLYGCSDPAHIELSLANVPDKHTVERSVNISVISTSAVAYKYKLDNGNFSSERDIDKNIVLTDLALGTHSLCVIGRIKDTWQKESEGYKITWTIDVNPASIDPLAVLANLPQPETIDTFVSIEVRGNIVSYKYKIDNEPYSEELPVNEKINLVSVTEGEHTLWVMGKNEYGTWQTEATEFSWKVDLTPPVALLINLPFTITSYNRINVRVSMDECVEYRYKLDYQSFSTIRQADETIQDSGLTEGDHQLEVIGRDRAGNWQLETESTVYSWRIDSSGAIVDLNNLPGEFTNNRSISVDVGGAGFTAYKYHLNDEEWSSEMPISTPITASGLNEGEQTLHIVGLDSFGEWQTERVVSWLIDLTPPRVDTINDIYWTNQPARASVSASDILECTYLWQVIEGDGDCTITDETSEEITLSGADGLEELFLIQVRVTDQAGNSTSRQFIFHWDSKPPSVDAGPDLGWWGAPGTPHPVITDVSPLSYTWRQTGGSGTLSFNNRNLEKPLISGPGGVEEIYTIEVSAVDAVGNRSSDTLLLSWDSIAPAPVRDLTAESYAFQSTLNWQNPTDDIIGVLIIRNTTTPVTEIVNGYIYTQSDLEGGDILVYKGLVDRYVDKNLIHDTGYHYNVYAYDKGNNYSEVNEFFTSTTIPIAYVNNQGSDSNDGLAPQSPVRSINAGINALNNRGCDGEVWVSAGSYIENVIMRDGISILGGYNQDWSLRNKIGRDDPLFRTVLNPEAIQPVVYFDNLGENTSIEGFVINQPSELPVISCYEASPVIAYNTITGGQGVSNKNNSSPLIKNNIIIGGAGSLSSGISNENSSNPIILGNVIHGGFGSKGSYGIFNKHNSISTIRNNTISGGLSDSTSYGIYIDESPGMIIENNIIFVSGGSIQYCIYEYYNGDPGILRNNLLTGATYLYHDDDLKELDIHQVNELHGIDTGRSNIGGFDPHFLRAENYNNPSLSNWQEMQEEGFDWHLTAYSGIDIKAGGRDLSFALTLDLDGKSRTTYYSSMGFVDPTMPKAGGWSLGAYEFD